MYQITIAMNLQNNNMKITFKILLIKLNKKV